MEENIERYLNVPDKHIKDNEITKALKEYEESLVEISKVRNLLSGNFIDFEEINNEFLRCRFAHNKVLDLLNNRLVRVYGRCTDAFNKFNSYTEYIGLLQYYDDNSIGNTFTDHPTNWHIKGISIHRNAESDGILWIDIENRRFHILYGYDINSNTIEPLTKEEYCNFIDFHFKSFLNEYKNEADESILTLK